MQGGQRKYSGILGNYRGCALLYGKRYYAGGALPGENCIPEKKTYGGMHRNGNKSGESLPGWGPGRGFTVLRESAGIYRGGGMRQ